MEIFDIYDRFGKKTGETIARGTGLRKGQYRLAVNTWIINNDKLLLQQRASGLKTAAGMWSCTSGGTVAGEKPEKTVLRECNEELGLKFAYRDLIFLTKSISFNSYWIYSYAIHKKVDISKIILQESEVQDVKWFTIEEIEELIDANKFFYNAKIWAEIKIYTKFWGNFKKSIDFYVNKEYN